MTISREAWALGIAEAAAQRSKCVRSQVGAAIFDSDWRVLSVGYNGSERNGPECADACPRARSTVEPGSSYDTGAGACIYTHAEMGALLYSDTVRRVGGLMAVTRSCCDGCMRIVKCSGLARVIWPGGEWNRG